MADTDEYSELEAVARKATPGPWRQDTVEPSLVWGFSETCGVSAVGNLRTGDDAAFIAAASPDVVLELIRRIETLEKAQEWWADDDKHPWAQGLKGEGGERG